MAISRTCEGEGGNSWLVIEDGKGSLNFDWKQRQGGKMGKRITGCFHGCGGI